MRLQLLFLVCSHSLEIASVFIELDFFLGPNHKSKSVKLRVSFLAELACNHTNLLAFTWIASRVQLLHVMGETAINNTLPLYFDIGSAKQRQIASGC